MAAIYFISDAHFGAGSPATEQKKLKLLKGFFRHICLPQNRLVIVGDFFDVWFEYKNAIPNDYFPVLRTLADLTDAGVKIDFLTGNHDCWMDQFLPDVMGITTHYKPIVLNEQGKHIYIGHGHGLLGQKKLGDKLLKSIIESPINIFLYRLLSPDIGLPLARKMSQKSRQHGEKRGNQELFFKHYEDFALRTLAESDYDALIFGHTHTPMLRTIDGKTYLNTGDWIHHFSYGKLKNGELTLNYWK